MKATFQYNDCGTRGMRHKTDIYVVFNFSEMKLLRRILMIIGSFIPPSRTAISPKFRAVIFRAGGEPKV